MSEEPTPSFPDETVNLNQVVAEIRAVNHRLQSMESRLQSMDARLQNMEARQQSFEDKFDARARETQPMSERINQILSEVAATRHELREVNRTLRRMNVDLATALRNQDDLEDRIITIETRLGPS